MAEAENELRKLRDEAWLLSDKGVYELPTVPSNFYLYGRSKIERDLQALKELKEYAATLTHETVIKQVCCNGELYSDDNWN